MNESVFAPLRLLVALLLAPAAGGLLVAVGAAAARGREHGRAVHPHRPERPPGQRPRLRRQISPDLFRLHLLPGRLPGRHAGDRRRAAPFEARIRRRAARVQPIFISVDPARDTPAVLRQFVAAFHPRMIGLTGSEAEIAQVAREYRIYLRSAASASAGGGYMVNHSRDGGALRARRPADRDDSARSGAGGRRRRAGALGAMRERFWEAPIEVARPRGMGGACATAAANAACTSSRTTRPASSIRPTSPAACSTGPAAAAPITNCAGSSCPIACGSTPPSSREIDWLPSTCAYRLRARRQAAARMALSDQRRPRDACTRPACRCAAGRFRKMKLAISNIISSTVRSEHRARRGEADAQGLAARAADAAPRRSAHPRR